MSQAGPRTVVERALLPLRCCSSTWGRPSQQRGRSCGLKSARRCAALATTGVQPQRTVPATQQAVQLLLLLHLCGCCIWHQHSCLLVMLRSSEGKCLGTVQPAGRRRQPTGFHRAVGASGPELRAAGNSWELCPLGPAGLLERAAALVFRRAGAAPSALWDKDWGMISPTQRLANDSTSSFKTACRGSTVGSPSWFPSSAPLEPLPSSFQFSRSTYMYTPGAFSNQPCPVGPRHYVFLPCTRAVVFRWRCCNK